VFSATIRRKCIYILASRSSIERSLARLEAGGRISKDTRKAVNRAMGISGLSMVDHYQKKERDQRNLLTNLRKLLPIRSNHNDELALLCNA
jgi:hypothetical protein